MNRWIHSCFKGTWSKWSLITDTGSNFKRFKGTHSSFSASYCLFRLFAYLFVVVVFFLHKMRFKRILAAIINYWFGKLAVNYEGRNRSARLTVFSTFAFPFQDQWYSVLKGSMYVRSSAAKCRWSWVVGKKQVFRKKKRTNSADKHCELLHLY